MAAELKKKYEYQQQHPPRARNIPITRMIKKGNTSNARFRILKSDLRDFKKDTGDNRLMLLAVLEKGRISWENGPYFVKFQNGHSD